LQDERTSDFDLKQRRSQVAGSIVDLRREADKLEADLMSRRRENQRRNSNGSR
jgi:hypothetical protein